MTKLQSLLTVSGLVLGAMMPNHVLADGKIDVAIIGEPDTFDPMMSTKDVVGTVTQHIFENLYSFDANWAPSPTIAVALPEITDDGKTYTIQIREGLTFQDGSTLDAHDVVASLNRWMEVASRGKAAAEKIDSITATDDFTVVIALNTSFAPLLPLLSMNNSAAIIVPQEVIGADGLTKIIGSGPYMLAEHKPDQYIQLVRFDGFVSRDEAPNGAAGGKSQSLDEIRFVPVSDGSTRLEGLLAGEYDYAESIAPEGYDRLNSSDVAAPVLLRDYGWPFFANNNKAGLMADLNIRKAVQAAISEEDMLYAAFGSEDFFRADGSLYPENYIWHNTAGNELYNQANAAKAAEFLAAANYDGSPLRILTSHQYEFHFKMAEVAKVYLEAAGFKVQLDVVDWATLGQRRDDPALWDIYITHSPFIPEPTLNAVYDASNRLGWALPEKETVLAAFAAETDISKRQALYADLQRLVAEDVPFIKLGNFNDLRGQTKALNGVPETPWEFFWNATTTE